MTDQGDRPASRTASGGSDLVVIIPGMFSNYQGEVMERLVDAFAHRLGTLVPRVREYRVSTRQGEGVSQASIEIDLEEGVTRYLELRELAWSDLRPSMNDVGVFERLLRGGRLVVYWGQAFLRQDMLPASHSLRRWFIYATAALVAWYMLAIAAVLLAFGPDVLAFCSHVLGLFSSSRPAAAAAAPDSPWPKWVAAFAVAVLGLKATTQSVDLSWTFYAFMEDLDSFRHRLRLRLRGLLSHIVLNEQTWNRIVVVAHSFGTVVAADALGGSSTDGARLPSLHLITLGSPLEFLSCCDAEIRSLVESCLRANEVKAWTDFYAPEDPFCSKVPIAEDPSGKFRAEQIDLDATARAAGVVGLHDAYFHRAEVLDLVAGLTPMDALTVGAEGSASHLAP